MDERYDMVRAIRDPGFRYVRNFSPHRPWGQRYTCAFRVQPSMRSWYAEFEADRCDVVQSAYWGAKPSEELYEIARDPFEIENLAALAEHRERLAAMRQRLRVALDTLADVLARGNLSEVLAAQNALEYVWRAGHIPLGAAQALLRAQDFPEPAQRTPEFLLGLPADAASQAARGEAIPGFRLAIAEFN